MGIRQKFFLLAAVAGLIVAIISSVSYYIAYTNLSESVEHEIQASVEVEKQALETWLQEKLTYAKSAADVMSAVDSNSSLAKMNTLLGTGSQDSEILTMAVGNEDGFIMTFANGDITHMLDPRTRDWYKNAKSKGSPIFTDVYKDAVTGKQVVSIAVPYKNSAGNFRGAICEDVTLDVLSERVKKIHYRGMGFGYIVQSDGKILAASNPEETAETADKSLMLGGHFPAMREDGKGYFITDDEQVFGYTTIENTGWIMLISAPESEVFAQIHDLQLKYAGLAGFGIVVILLMMFVCIRLSDKLVSSISILQKNVQEMSQGILKKRHIEIDSDDEMGILGTAFNTMSNNIYELIKKTSSAADQVAASSEELTSSAHQSAESAINSAQAVQELVMGMSEQEKSSNEVKQISDILSEKIALVTEHMARVMIETARSQETAKEGGVLMKNAVEKMNSIEKNVDVAAEVVKNLGENSKQIGEIIDAISRIADQTNLLALNAAIEAARAGEQGKGFAVVADEVRKLASESQESAEKIRDLIQNVLQKTEEAVIAMESGNEEVRNGTSAVLAVGSRFNDILEMVTTAKEKVDAMSTNVVDMAHNAEKIGDAVERIDEIAQQIAQNTQQISSAAEGQSASNQEIAAASQTLTNMAVELQEAASKFKI